MSNVPEGLYYSKDHEWVRVEGDIGTIGITDYAQKALGDIVYVDLPKVGESLSADQVMGSVDSVKTTSEIYSPVSGEVVEVNSPLVEEKGDSTQLVNQDPYGKGWMLRIRISDPTELDSLLSAAEYEDHLEKNKPEER